MAKLTRLVKTDSVIDRLDEPTRQVVGAGDPGRAATDDDVGQHLVHVTSHKVWLFCLPSACMHMSACLDAFGVLARFLFLGGGLVATL